MILIYTPKVKNGNLVVKVSVVVRTLNEEKYIGKVLQKIRNQKDVNVEIVLVDNNSSDSTVSIASKYIDKLCSIKEFKPGLAINQGVNLTSSEIVAIISGHCEPISSKWLWNLTQPLVENQDKLVGVYGRQIPTDESSDLDKRDLLTIFGPEAKLQKKDPFFHNANSAITRAAWERTQFNEQTTNIEDRIWAKAQQSNGYSVLYQPTATVNHWHGINHNGDPQRAQMVVRSMVSYKLYEDEIIA